MRRLIAFSIAILSVAAVIGCGNKDESGFDNSKGIPFEDGGGAPKSGAVTPEAGAQPAPGAAPGTPAPEGDGNFREGQGAPN